MSRISERFSAASSDPSFLMLPMQTTWELAEERMYGLLAPRSTPASLTELYHSLYDLKATIVAIRVQMNPLDGSPTSTAPPTTASRRFYLPNGTGGVPFTYTAAEGIRTGHTPRDAEVFRANVLDDFFPPTPREEVEAFAGELDPDPNPF